MAILDKKKKLIIGASVLSVILLGIFTTYAYFSFKTNNLNRMNASLENGTMRLRFADNDNGLNKSLAFGETVTKKFKIENTGTLEGSLSLEWLNLVNTYLHSSLTYTLEEAVEENGEYREIVPKTNVPTSTEAITGSIASEISVPAGETYYYNLNVTLNNMDFNQTRDLSANLSTKFTVNNPSKHRYYLLRVNPNGGTWKEFTSSQDYLLKNNETMEIENPTRYGYTFKEWDIQGTSYELEDKTFIMGISDTYLKAVWTPKKVNVTIDGETRQVDFGSTIDLGTPDKEGYTFGGWETTGGALNGTLLTVDTEEDITATPILATNKYKYIVYHHKMNTDGIGYTLVDADTDEGEAAFNTIVTPEVKTYIGFTSPERKTLTIQAESVYPPVKNKVDYNYTRNKHTLSFNIDGITTTEEVYYEQIKELVIPEKEGYNFTNWSGADEYINDNVLTVPDANVSITANFTPKTYSVTFNANGGFVTPESKVVTYDQEYGEMPTPVYVGFKFLGWFTSQIGGTKINDTDIVKLSANITLYAHWEESNILMARADDKKLWENATDITKVVFSKEITPKSNATYSEDVSSNQNGSVMSYLVPNADNTTYTAYIEANGEVVGNPNSKALFSGFSKLETIEGLENFDTSNVTTMWDMFSGCTNLKAINLENFNTSKVTNMQSMFASCSSLTLLDLNSFVTSNVENMAHLFEDCINLTSININKFDTSKVSNMFCMFHNCHKLISLDLKNFVTTNVINIAAMFMGCSNLTSLDISSFDTSKVYTMYGMFADCKSLTVLNVSNFITSNVTEMHFMFLRCSSLESLDLRNFNTSKVSTMANMFYSCSSLTSLKVDNFDTSNVTTMYQMFYGCSNLTSLNLSNFKTSKVTTMEAMFLNCSKLETLDFSSFNTTNVTNMKNMFYSCSTLSSLNLSGFDTSNVTTMHQMFRGCSNLTYLNLNNCDTSKVTTFEGMFADCGSLTNLLVKNLIISDKANTFIMFTNINGSVNISVTDTRIMDFIINVSDNPKLNSTNFTIV